jgi:glycosyltransferase involved in cell wall biosynthesis
LTSLVVRVLAKLEPGGAQLSALRVVRGLEEHGIASRVLVGWASPEGLELAARMSVEVEVYGAAGDLQWRTDPGFARWLAPRLLDAPLVHAHMFGGWSAAASAIPPGVPLVASEHNALLWPGLEPVQEMRLGLRRVTRMYAHGPGARDAMLAAGLSPLRLREGISPIADLDGTPLPGLPTPRIVFAGRLHPDKGPDVLLDALALLPDAPPALLLGDGPLRPSLDRQIVRLGLSHRARMCGWQARPSTMIAGASLLVIPSRDESWSQTAVLAMGLGVPVIGTDVDGFPETLSGGRGIIVPVEDPTALAAAIEGVLSGRRLTNLLAARDYARRFSVDRVVGEYADAYRELTRSTVDPDVPDDDPLELAAA